jgi:hypothetical protein
MTLQVTTEFDKVKQKQTIILHDEDYNHPPLQRGSWSKVTFPTNEVHLALVDKQDGLVYIEDRVRHFTTNYNV